MNLYSVTTRLWGIVLLSMIVVLYLAAAELQSEVARLRSSEQTYQGLSSLSAISDICDHLQTERGRTADFLASGKTPETKKALENARKNTDQKLTKLEKNAGLSKRTQTAMDIYVSALNDIRSVRQQMEAEGTSVKSAVDTYSAIIEKGIDVISVMGSETTGELSNVIIALGNIQNAKERSGLARATGASYLRSLESGKENNQNAMSYITMLSQMDGFMWEFEKNMSHAKGLDIQDVKKIKQAESYKEFATQKNRILDYIFSGHTGNIFSTNIGIDANDWFAVSSKWIMTLKNLSEQIENYATILSSQIIKEQKDKIMTSAAFFAVIILITFSLTFSVVRNMSNGMKNVTEDIAKVAQGKLNDANLDKTAKDEFGTIGRAIEKLKEGLIEKDRLEQAAKKENEHKAEVENEKQKKQEKLNGFIGKNIQNIENLASSMEELSASITEIGSQVSRSVELIERTKRISESSSVKVAELGESTKEIDTVVDLIRSIAEKTNLLALNATIEAARAGEAGRGFSVVAGEVKVLSSQTTEATGSIDTQVSNIQTESMEVVSSIGRINESIEGVSEVSSAISEAITQQNIAISEISHNAHKIAEFSRRLKDDLDELARIA